MPQFKKIHLWVLPGIVWFSTGCQQVPQYAGIKAPFVPEGFYYIDSDQPERPSQNFQTIMRSIQEEGYHPPYRQYLYKREPVERPPTATAPPFYSGNYVTGCWSILMCAPWTCPESPPVIQIYGYELAGVDTLFRKHLEDYFGPLGKDKRILPDENLVYYLVPLADKYTPYKDSLFDVLNEMTSWRRKRNYIYTD
jgi:hypothetical protein